MGFSIADRGNVVRDILIARAFIALIIVRAFHALIAGCAICALIVGCAFCASIFDPFFNGGLRRHYLAMPILNSLFNEAAKLRVELVSFSGQDRLLDSPLFRSVLREAWVEGRAS